jgi:ATP-binding cassette subfamily F protein uup
MADPVFYKREPGAAAEVRARIDELERLHAAAFSRWEELEALRPKG